MHTECVLRSLTCLKGTKKRLLKRSQTGKSYTCCETCSKMTSIPSTTSQMKMKKGFRVHPSHRRKPTKKSWRPPPKGQPPGLNTRAIDGLMHLHDSHLPLRAIAINGEHVHARRKVRRVNGYLLLAHAYATKHLHALHANKRVALHVRRVA